MTHGKAAIPIDGGYVVKRQLGRVHATFDRAGAEAVKLTEENPGIGFTILKIAGTVADRETSRG